MFKEFPKIKSIKEAKKSAMWIGLEKVRYRVYPKIHGTNAGVRIQNGKITPQSRTRDLSIESDNAGFAAFISSNEERIFEIFGEEDQVIFGEWCGDRVQKTVATSQMSKRYFVVFKVLKNGNWSTPILPGEGRIRGIREFGELEIEVDFSNIAKQEDAYAILYKKMLEVEECCPVARGLEGLEGIGEGVVATLNGPEGLSCLWFKVKGEKHSKGAGSPRNMSSVDVIQAANAYEFMEKFFHHTRLMQGVDYLKENQIELDKKATKHYLGWCMKEFIDEGYNSYIDAELSEKYWKSNLNKFCAAWFVRMVASF